MTLFTERLYANVQPIWAQNHHHPFVQELGKGTLAAEKFIHYLFWEMNDKPQDWPV